MGINQELLKLASYQASKYVEKQALVPAGAGDPMAGGGDPMAGGGMPPGGDPMAGGAPPMDPMMGGAPPMDPMMGGMPADPSMDPMMGGMPADPSMDPMMGGMPPEPAAPPEDIRKIIQEELANANSAAAPDVGGPAGAKAKKFDPAELDVKLYNMEKLIVAISNALGVSLPPEALLGPPPEGTIAPEAPGSPESGPAVGGDPSSIKPIDPIQPATPTPADDGGALKISSAVPTVGQPIAMNAPGTAAELFNKTAAMAAMARSINNRG
jgi:hypothetical protein